MNRGRIALALSLLVSCTSPPHDDEAGWRPLFDGRSLEGWTTSGSARWRAEDGILVGGQEGDPKRSGTISTTDRFGDFELDLEFMIDEHGKYNSGIYLRQKPGAPAWQVNIGRGAASEYCGGIHLKEWLAKGDEKDEIRRPLEWNRLRILAAGPAVKVWLNGTLVSDFRAENPDPRLLEPGAIALQTYGAEGHSGWVKFRNLRVRDQRTAGR